MGHEVITRDKYDKKMGGVNGVSYLDDGTIVGGADPRRDGLAIGI